MAALVRSIRVVDCPGFGRVEPVASAPTANAYSRPLVDIHDRQLSGIQSFFPVLHECGNLYELDARAHSVETGHALE